MVEEEGRGRGPERILESVGDQNVLNVCDNVRMKPCDLYNLYKPIEIKNNAGESDWGRCRP